MKNVKSIIAAFILSAGICSIFAAQAFADQPNLKRFELQKGDLNVPTHEVIVMRAEFDPQASAPKHTHFGVELIYVIEGTVEYQLEGKPMQTLKAGDTVLVPAGAAHSAKNVGKTTAKVLATYIVEKGKTLATPVK